MNVHQRLWASACAIASELDARSAAIAQPSFDFEASFNGRVAPDAARHYAEILTSGALPEDARILDLGCGFGRIAMALARQLAPKVRYFGLDPNAGGIEWAQRNITPHHPNFTFRRIDVRSLPYNPLGRESGGSLRFPFEDASLDLVFMISVLTHVDLATVETYLREAARVLKPSGRLVTTMFLLDDEVDHLLAAGKGSFRMAAPCGPSRVENLANPELAIAHPRQRVVDILQSAGFARHAVFNGSWSGRASATPMDFQDLLIASHHPGPIRRPVGQAAVMPDALTAEQQRLCDRIDRLTGDDARLSRFITWSNALTLNALWWRVEGRTLALGEGTGAVPLPLRLEALRKLGLENIRPDVEETGGAFQALDDAAMMALVIRTGQTAGRALLLDVLFEAAENGLCLLEACRAGKAALLTAPGRPPRPVTIAQLPD